MLLSKYSGRGFCYSVVQYKELKVLQSSICFIPSFTDFLGQDSLMPYILSSVRAIVLYF